MKQHTELKIIMLFCLGFVEIISSPCKRVLTGVFLSNHLASTDNLTSNNQQTERIQTQTNVNTKVALINNNIHTNTYANRKDRQSLVCLVAFYYIWPGNESILITPEPAQGCFVG